MIVKFISAKSGGEAQINVERITSIDGKPFTPPDDVAQELNEIRGVINEHTGELEVLTNLVNSIVAQQFSQGTQ